MKLQLSIQRNYKIFYSPVFPKGRGVFRTQSNIEDGAFCEDSKQFNAVNCFKKELHLRCLVGF